MSTPIVTPYPNTEFEKRLHRMQRQRDMALRGYERNRMSPELAEALRTEIRKALDADGKPFDVVVAQRVYDLAIAAKDMCVAATAGVGETIKTIANNGGPIESLGELEPGAPAVQAQASETFGARIFRELMATLKPQPSEDSRQLVLVHALAAARRNGMTDVARELEIKLFGHELHSSKPIEDGEHGSYELGFADGKQARPPMLQTGDYHQGYLEGTKARYLEDATLATERTYEQGFADGKAGRNRANETPSYIEGYVDGVDAGIRESTPHPFEARSTSRYTGPCLETCEQCGKDPRNTVHNVKPAEVTQPATVEVI